MGGLATTVWAYLRLVIATLVGMFLGVDKGYVKLFAAVMNLNAFGRGENAGCQITQTSRQASWDQMGDPVCVLRLACLRFGPC
jgi:hypothetical protein